MESWRAGQERFTFESFRNPVSQPSSGFFTIMTTGKGQFTGKLQVGAAKFSAVGPIGTAGTGHADIARQNLSPLSLDFQIDLADPDHITGTLSDNATFTAELVGDRLVFDKLVHPAPQAGHYTWTIPGNDSSAIVPGGDSFGTIALGADGKAKVSLSLADGMKVSQAVPISKNGQLPFYGSLYTGHGLILGWITFSNAPAEDLSADVRWIKPALATAKFYSAGFTFGTTASGSGYTNCAPGTNILKMTDGTVVLSGGNLSQNITNLVSLLANNKITNTSPNKLALTFTPTTGLFKGTVVNPDALTSRPFTFGGVVLQKQNVACGFSLGNNQTARALLAPTP